MFDRQHRFADQRGTWTLVANKAGRALRRRVKDKDTFVAALRQAREYVYDNMDKS